MCGVWDRLHFLVNREVLEWRMTIDRLVENTAEQPYITWSADFEAPHAIWKLDSFSRHVVDGAELSVEKHLRSELRSTTTPWAKTHLMISLNVDGIIGNSICDAKTN
jgi:hypothetical protein